MVFKVEEVSVCVCLLEEKSLDGDVYMLDSGSIVG